MAKIEFIESYIKYDGSDYEWSDNHGELIRCKNCKFFSNGRECMRPIWHIDGTVEYPSRRVDDYCSYAEKKDYSTADTPQTDCGWK